MESKVNQVPVVSDEAKRLILKTYRARTASSFRAHQQALPVLPGGVSRNIVYHEPYPLFCNAGDGAYVEDLDGNRYLDVLGNYTALVLGHRHPAVLEAVRSQIERGTAWAAATTAEAVLATLLAQRVPSVEQARFTASGTEATMVALRAARAVTGRPLVAKFEGGYHGLHDYAMVSVHPSSDQGEPDADGRPRAIAADGIPTDVRDSVIVLPFNDHERVEAIISSFAPELAAVIVEPVMGVAGVIPPQAGFLQSLRNVTSRHGIILIFDEVMTLRLGWGGAQERFGVVPDITTFGKMIGGGFPVGAVGGSRKLMKIFDPPTPRVLLSGTFHANPVTLAAGIATLQQLTPAVIDHLNRRGEQLVAWLRAESDGLASAAQVTGVGSLFNIHFNRQEINDYRSSSLGDVETLKWLHLALLNEGILIGPRGIGCICAPMGDVDFERFRSATKRAFNIITQGLL